MEEERRMEEERLSSGEGISKNGHKTGYSWYWRYFSCFLSYEEWNTGIQPLQVSKAGLRCTNFIFQLYPNASSLMSYCSKGGSKRGRRSGGSNTGNSQHWRYFSCFLSCEE